jgi:hypothetical protein
MLAYTNGDASDAQSSTVLNNLNNRLPDAKIVRRMPMTARELSRVLGGRAAGDEWWGEGYVVGDEAWIDDRTDGEIYIRCRDIKRLLRRAERRLATPDGIVRRYAPTLRGYMGTRVTVGKRSSVIYKIVRGLLEAGASVREVECVIGASAVGASKFGGNAALVAREVWRILDKLLREKFR